MKKKRRPGSPSSPMQIALRRADARSRERDPAAWGIDATQLELGANREVEISIAAGGKVGRARRADIFDLFLARGKLSAAAHGAVRRLQDDMAVLHRTLAGGGEFTPRVDRSLTPTAFSERRLRAAHRIDEALSLAGPASARIVAALCEADVVLGRAGAWRAVVERESGERLADGQSAVLRMACDNLAGAYGLIDRGRGRAGRDRAEPPAERPGTPQ
jgi:hypothetical protein